MGNNTGGGSGGSSRGGSAAGSGRRRAARDYSDDSDDEEEYRRRRRRARRARDREDEEAGGEPASDSEEEERERRRRKRDEQKRKKKKETIDEVAMPAPPVARVEVQPVNDEDELLDSHKEFALAEDDIMEEDDKQVVKKPPKTYGEWGTNNEYPQFAWGCCKLIAYFLFFLVAIFVYINDYNKKPCTILEPDWTLCTLDTAVDKCVVSNDLIAGDKTGVCYNQCLSQSIKPDNNLVQGCLKTYNNTGLTSNICYNTSTFSSVCRDPDTCTDEAEVNIKGGFRNLVILLAFILGVELVYTFALWQFKGYHPNDFAEQDKCTSYLILMVKVSPSLLQVGWIFHLVLLLNLVYVYSAHKDSCSGAKTVTNGKYTLYSHSVMYIGATSALLVLACVIGSICRLEYPLRGMLYSPSNIDEINPPLGLDCRKCRDRPGTKCFPDATAACKRENSLAAKLLGECCAICCSTLFNVCCSLCGRLCGACWRDRHFLGP